MSKIMAALQVLSGKSVVADRKDVNCAVALLDNFSGKKYYTRRNIDYAAEVVCGLNLPEEQLALFLLYSSPYTNAGRFAYTFNHDLYLAVEKEDTNLLEKLANLTKEGDKALFPELYSNNTLSKEEKKVIADRVDKEYAAIVNSLARYSLSSKESNMFPYALEESTCVYSKCYREVCNYQRDDTSSSSLIPSVVYAIDKMKDCNMTCSYCFQVEDIIKQLAYDVPMNPVTEQPLGKEAVESLRNKYQVEIKMYRYYLDKLNE